MVPSEGLSKAKLNISADELFRPKKKVGKKEGGLPVTIVSDAFQRHSITFTP